MMQPNWINPRASKNVRERMKPLLADGMTQAQVARELGVSPSAVCRAVNRGRKPPGKIGRPRKIVTEQKAEILALRKERDRLREILKTMKQSLSELPSGEWETQTGSSFRRIGRKGGADGDVLHATVHHYDGHPDLSWNERKCDAICSVVNGLRAALKQEDEG